MGSLDSRFWIAFSGEIYNFQELRGELKTVGFVFKTATDTEVLLAAYQAWGEKCLSPHKWDVGHCHLGRRTTNIVVIARPICY